MLQNKGAESARLECEMLLSLSWGGSVMNCIYGRLDSDRGADTSFTDMLQRLMGSFSTSQVPGNLWVCPFC